MKLNREMKLNRRTFLQSTGVAMALPWLESMQPAWAKEQAAPKRMVFICNTLGLHAPALFPKKTGVDYDLPDYLSII